MTPTRTLLMLTLAVLLDAGRSTAAPERKLGPQIKQLAQDLKDALATDPKLNGQRLKIGGFSGPQLERTNFGKRLKDLLKAELAKVTDESASFTLTGRYDYVESDESPTGDPDVKLQVIRITVVIEDKKARELVRKSAEVNDTDDIIDIVGGTVAPPLNGTHKTRNDAAKKAQTAPTFEVRQKTRIAIPGQPFAVEILVKPTADGPADAIAPENKDGQAFVPLKADFHYEIVLHSEAKFEVAAKIKIDGQDVITTFNTDAKKAAFYLIPESDARSHRVRGWMHTVAKGAKDSVFSFRVAGYGPEGPEAGKPTGEVGVITVAFHGSWPKGQPMPDAIAALSRGVNLQTVKGEPIAENYEVVARDFSPRLATISVRYDLPAK